MVAQGCLQSLANGLGEEIFRFNEHSQLVSEDSGLCVVFTGVGPAGGVSWDSCQEALDANNGKSTLKFLYSFKVANLMVVSVKRIIPGCAIVSIKSCL